ncbi:protein TIFY 8-like [Neltuma alba]|uniref:protein TIFY 8-like n=1 Tax=Neltuma alba TaxID=207710 RepID=UPI0010A2D969|nr:protein TIFY 8-like [Prosopis alba]
MAMLRMEQHSNGNHSSSQQSVKPVFHDFMGMKPTDSPLVAAPKTADTRPAEASPSSASVSVGAPSGVARGPLSTTSDTASDRQLGNHLEGVPFYSSRSDLSGTEISNRIVGNKRSNSDSSFMSYSRDAFQMVPDSLQNLHLMKSRKPTSASHIYQPSMGAKTDVNKWERSILMNTGSSMQHPPHGGQLASFVHQIPSNKSRDANAGPSFISHSAADEGSRTGIKGPGILSSMNTTTAAYEKSLSALGGSRPKPLTGIIDPESSMPPSQQGLASASCQMTIFYGGQAHVFDNVHPNKAEIIMALAGSNGGCCSTTYSQKPAVKLPNHSHVPCGDSETGMVSKITPPQAPQGGSSFAGTSNLAIKPGNRMSTQAGAHQGRIVANEDVRNSIKASDPSYEGKRTRSH